MVYNIHVRGYSLMVKLQLPKLAMRVRFPLLAPKGKDTEGCPFLLEKITGARDRFKLRQKEPVFEKLVQLDQLAVGEVWVQIPVTRSKRKGHRRDTYHKAGRCPLAFLLIGLDARMNCSKIKI